MAWQVLSQITGRQEGRLDGGAERGKGKHGAASVDPRWRWKGTHWPENSAPAPVVEKQGAPEDAPMVGQRGPRPWPPSSGAERTLRYSFSEN